MTARGPRGSARGRSSRARAARRIVAGVLAVFVTLIGVLGIEALIAVQTVPDDGYRPPSQAPRSFGQPGGGPPLRYVVLGDSTATGRGAPYERGIAVLTARHLAAGRQVTLTNLAVSGARMGDVRRDQLPAAVRIAPDAVLISAGANDVTGLTRLGSATDDLQRIVDRLRDARCDVAIVVTASPDMGAPPRLPQPLRAVAGWRSRQLNDAIRSVVRERDLVLAPIAQRTGQRFRDDRSLFAADGFHPSAAGYATWVPIIEAALDAALARRGTPPEGCRPATRR
ncbi:MAG: SGNH/GDSL hydrolase family protein [Solirubrobacteraceae bacterium]